MSLKYLVASGADNVTTFDSFSAWWASLPSTLTEPEELSCGNFEYDATAEAGIGLIGKTTSSANYVRIFTTTANRHDGRHRAVSGQGFCFKDTGSFITVRIGAGHVRLEGLELYESGDNKALSVASGTDIRIDGCLIHNTEAGAQYTAYLSAAGVITITNTVFSGNCRTWDTRDAASVKAYNVVGLRFADQLGFVSSAELEAINCYSAKTTGSSDDYWSGGAPTGHHNASSDTSATARFTSSLNNISPSAALTSAVYGSEDFRLKAGTNALVDAGATISATSTDALGNSRPAGAAYDIGAIERDAGATSTVPAAPTLVATPGDTTVSVDVTVGSDGGSPITSTVVTQSPGGATQTITGSGGATLSWTGLTNGTLYTYTGVSINAIGTSATSADATATPVAPPAAPTGVITSFTFDGQDVTVSGTTTNTPTSGVLSLIADPTTPNGAVSQGPGALTLGSGTFSIVFAGTPTGNYSAITGTVTNAGGTVAITGGTEFTIEAIGEGGQVITAPTAVTLTGPTTGTVGVASTNFTVNTDYARTVTTVVTPTPVAGVTFTPTSVSLAAGTASGTFTATSSTTGAKTIAVTNDQALTNPASITYTVSAATDTTNPSLSGSVTFSSTTASSTVTTWPAATDNVAVTGYEQQVGGGSFVDMGNVLSASLTGLSPSTGYTVGVRAYDAAGNRSDTITGSVTTTAAVLSFKATILVGGVWTQITDAQIGTGKKPIVYVSGRFRERQTTEGTPVIKVGNRYRLLHAGETLEV